MIPKYLFFNRLEERGEICSFEHYLLSVFVISLSVELPIKIEFYIGSFQYLKFIAEFIDNVFYPLFALISYPDVDEFFVWRVGERFSFGECMNEKIPVVSLGDIFEEIRFWYKSLDKNI